MASQMSLSGGIPEKKPKKEWSCKVYCTSGRWAFIIASACDRSRTLIYGLCNMGECMLLIDQGSIPFMRALKGFLVSISMAWLVKDGVSSVPSSPRLWSGFVSNVCCILSLQSWSWLHLTQRPKLTEFRVECPCPELPLTWTQRLRTLDSRNFQERWSIHRDLCNRPEELVVSSRGTCWSVFPHYLGIDALRPKWRVDVISGPSPR